MVNIETMKLEHISKFFDNTIAVSDVGFSLSKGKVYSIIGENGAGKSTIVKIMNGTYRQDKGDIYINNKKVQFTSPSDAADHGVGMVYQELHLLPNLSVTENIFVSQLTSNKLGIINWKILREKAQKYMDTFHVQINPDELVGNLKVAHQQIVAIIRAYAMDSRVMILDEPTSALPAKDIGAVKDVVKKLRELDCIVIYISHKLEEVLEMSDEIIAMRNGEKVGEFHAGEMTKERMVELIAGRTLKNKFPKKDLEKGGELLRFENVSVKGLLEDVSFTLYKGEILGFSGLLGAGKTEVAQTLFGVYGNDFEGKIFLGGKEFIPQNPKKAVEKKIGLIPENRASEGLILDHSVKDNALMACIKNYSTGGWINNRSCGKKVAGLVDALKVKCGSVELPVRTLSGGNQQKVVLAKWLAAESDIVIFDEPTRGIDVGAKYEIYNLMNDLAEQGVGVIIMSSEVDEVLGMADRAVILKDGMVKGIIKSKEVSEDALLQMI